MSDVLREAMSKPAVQGKHISDNDYGCPSCGKIITITRQVEHSFCVACNLRIQKGDA